MKLDIVKSVLFIGCVAATSTSFADHNSVWGEGWANMPNDIHNTRIDTLGDNDTFTDFVRYGAGADSVNRFTDTTVSPSRSLTVTGAGISNAGVAGGSRR